MHKILVWLGLALTAILVIENMVLPNPAYFFIDSNSKSWIVALWATLIWIWIWYWLAWFVKKDPMDDDNLDF